MIFLPYLTGERTPYSDPNARGVFFGITLRHGKAHFVRSIYEGVAYGLRDSFEILNEMAVPIDQVPGLRRRIQKRGVARDTGGYHRDGARPDKRGRRACIRVALLAGVGTGIYPSVGQACRSTIKVTSITKPEAARKSLYDRYYRVYRALYPALKDQFASIAQMVSAARGAKTTIGLALGVTF